MYGVGLGDKATKVLAIGVGGRGGRGSVCGGVGGVREGGTLT